MKRLPIIFDGKSCPSAEETTCSPSQIFAFEDEDFSEESANYVDWNLTLKNFCEAFHFNSAFLGVAMAQCKQNCTEKYHLLGLFNPAGGAAVTKSARLKRRRGSDCALLCEETSLLYQAAKTKTFIIASKLDNDLLTSEAGLFCPLILPNGEIIGVFGCGMNAAEVNAQVPATIICTLQQMTYLLQAYVFHKREGILRKEMVTIAQQTVREIGSANRSRDAFIATMSHEIRTPLTSIIAALQLLRTQKIAKENESKITRLYDVAQTSSVQLLELINDILDFCKLRSTNLKLADEQIDLHKTLMDAVNIFHNQCTQKGINLIVNFTEIENVHVLGDSKRIMQILLNLISNSLKFTDVGSIAITAKLHRKRNELGSFLLALEVRDTGTGITAENMKQIFEPYFTAKREDWKNVLNGVGLGLAICKELTTLMGGTIKLESDGISGTQAYVELPFKDADYLKMVQQRERVEPLLANENIIVLDDRLEQRMHMMKMVTQWGMVPHSFTNSAEALMALQVLGAKKFKIALVDIDLSGSVQHDTGVLFAQSIRSSEAAAHLKLIAVSSVGGTFGGDQLFDQILLKPISEMQLYDTIRKCLLSYPQMTPKKRRRRSFASSSDLLRDNSVQSVRSASELLPVPVRRSSGLDADEAILIVDDDRQNAEIFKDMLEQLNQTNVQCVNSASECLFTLSNEPDKYQIIFMDVVMPTTSGIDCVKRIRSMPQRYGTPKIIALTADAVESTRFTCLHSGFDFFVTKPVTLDDFENALKWVNETKNK